jgi:putative peptidoglycan lipid II flippase
MSQITTNFKRFFSGTLLSRISGLGRDLAMAFAFADHPSVAAFMVAFRFSHLFRRLLGEGPLQAAFIPFFEEQRVKNQSEAALFFQRFTSFLVLLLCGLTLASEAILLLLLFFGNFSPDNQEILHLTCWLLPGLIFICLYGINLSFLNCYDAFFIPSMAPLLCNSVWIVAALLLRHQNPPQAMVNLSKWVVMGFATQWLITLPGTLKHAAIPYREWFRFSIPKEVKALAKSFAFGAIGVGATQINSLADALFARYADIRGPVYLWYSIRIEQLAFAMLGIGCVAALTPRLSRAIKEGAHRQANELFQEGFKKILFTMIPCTFLILLLGYQAVDLLYGRGHFHPHAVYQTSCCLAAYSLGLVPSTLVLLFSAIFYAENNFKMPLKASLISIGFNGLLNYLFVFHLQLGVISTALSTSGSALLNCAILGYQIQRKGWKPAFTLKKHEQ